MTGPVMVSVVALGAMLQTTPCGADFQDRCHYDGLRSSQSDGEHCVGLGSQVVRSTNYLTAHCPRPIRTTSRLASFSAAPLAHSLDFELVSDFLARLRLDELRSLQCARAV